MQEISSGDGASINLSKEIIVLEVELDVLSGIPIPTTLYELLSAGPSQIPPVGILSKQFGLGYRGLIVRRIKTNEGLWDKTVLARRTQFPNEFRIGNKAASVDGRGAK